MSFPPSPIAAVTLCGSASKIWKIHKNKICTQDVDTTKKKTPFYS